MLLAKAPSRLELLAGAFQRDVPRKELDVTQIALLHPVESLLESELPPGEALRPHLPATPRPASAPRATSVVAVKVPSEAAKNSRRVVE